MRWWLEASSLEGSQVAQPAAAKTVDAGADAVLAALSPRLARGRGA
jgi:hypothetical protein